MIRHCAFLFRRAEQEGMAALIRLNSRDAFFLAAPPLSESGQWFEHRSGSTEREHSAEEKIAAFGGLKIALAEK